MRTTILKAPRDGQNSNAGAISSQIYLPQGAADAPMDVLSSTSRASQRASRAQKHAGIRILAARGRQHTVNGEALPLNPHLRLCTLYRRWRQSIEKHALSSIATLCDGLTLASTFPAGGNHPRHCQRNMASDGLDTVIEFGRSCAASPSCIRSGLPTARRLPRSVRRSAALPRLRTAFQSTADTGLLKHSLLLKDDSL